MKPIFRRLTTAWKVLTGKTGKRNVFPGAAVNRLTQDFTVQILSPDAAIWTDLVSLRARARTLERQNDYVRAWLLSAEKNVLGNAGVRLQNKAYFRNGSLDKRINTDIEEGWKTWGKKDCTMDGKSSWHGVQRLALRTALRDGEVLCRLVPNPDNQFGLSLHLFEADHLDENFNVPKLQNGNRIVMSVELNPWGKPVAYHVLKNHPGDLYGSGYMFDRERIPAEECIHLFLPDRIGQSRGYPHCASPMLRLNHLAGYEEAEVVAARAGAQQMGFLTKQTPEGWQPAEEDDDGNAIMPGQPGSITELPMGYDFKAWEPNHPNAVFPEFRKAMLRGIAAGLGINYNNMASDLEAVNYSSLRSGALDERETWKMLQRWFIDNFITPIFETWLFYALMSGKLMGMVSDYDRLNSPEWIARRWPWVDPSKDVDANIKAIDAKLVSRRQVIAENGNDIETVYEETSEDNQLAVDYGLEEPEPEEPTGPAEPEEPGEDDEDDDPPMRHSINITADHLAVTKPTRKAVSFVRDEDGNMVGAEVTEVPVEEGK